MRRGPSAAAIAVAIALAAPLAPAAAQPVVGSQCLDHGTWAGDVASADEILANRYTFPPHPTVSLPENLTWLEDPFNDRNWRHRLQSLTYLRHLWVAWERTADLRYRDRLASLLRDWFEDNHRLTTSDFAWNPHSSAWRAMTYACALEVVNEPFMLEVLDLHGRALAMPQFYVERGNAALNQSLGLLAVGCVRGNSSWMDTAVSRIRDLVVRSIDAQGVTNEQSVEYHLYNYNRYGEAVERLQACGLQVPPELTERRALMADFLAHATLPNGEYALLGDSHARPAQIIPGTAAEFAATRGASGPRPADPWATYTAGYAFGRSGWGERRPFADEVHYSLRFGPARIHHGHFDGTSVTVYGHGSRLLLDPSFDRYEFDRWRDYFRSPSAHNVVTVDDTAYSLRAPTWFSAQRHYSTFDFLYVRNAFWEGVRAKRRILFSRNGGYLLVEDLLAGAERKTFRQLWHLAPGSSPGIAARRVTTAGGRGNVTLQWLGGAAPDLRVLEGRTSPLQGWVAFEYGATEPAPVVEAVLRGRTAHYVTLIVPSEAPNPPVTIRDFRMTDDGFRATITVGTHTDRVIVDGALGSLSELSA